MRGKEPRAGKAVWKKPPVAFVQLGKVGDVTWHTSLGLLPILQLLGSIYFGCRRGSLVLLWLNKKNPHCGSRKRMPEGVIQGPEEKFMFPFTNNRF